MRILSAELTSWRNYQQQRLVFDGSPTIFVGSNGQGNTNFVEALVYAALGHSHRTANDSVVVRSGAAEAVIRITVSHNDRKLSIDLKIAAAGSNVIRVNGSPSSRRDLARLLPLVLFAPEDMDLIRGEPDHRRTFMNDALTESSSTMAGAISDYDRVLRQRNMLLKSLRTNPQADHGTLDTWTNSLVDYASRIMLARRRLVAELVVDFTGHYRAIASSDDLAILSLSESIGSTTTDGDIATQLTEKFAAIRRDEIDRGMTLAGPHRDDLVITLNSLPARTHSSQGEAWSAALALRLSQVDLLRRTSVAGDPVVVLDDVFSELDEGRRYRLGEHLTGIEHVIITAADVSTIPDSLTGIQHVVTNGHIDVETPR
ncbi:MAG: DNA replication/repair protein RecF [Microbacteriaceae bacterium]|nr:DNA replication/repair protein RecF [Microbacteriaceae bacterium]